MDTHGYLVAWENHESVGMRGIFKSPPDKLWFIAKLPHTHAHIHTRADNFTTSEMNIVTYTEGMFSKNYVFALLIFLIRISYFLLSSYVIDDH